MSRKKHKKNIFFYLTEVFFYIQACIRIQKLNIIRKISMKKIRKISMKKIIKIAILFISFTLFFIINDNFFNKNETKSEYILVNKNENKTKNIKQKIADSRKSIIGKTTEYIIPQIYTDSSWETKTIYGKDGNPITYVFGEGNPKEVALSDEEFKKLPEKVLEERVAFLTYMTPEAENAMKEFLDNPDLPYVIEKCYKELNWYGTDNFRPKFPHNFSMEYIMYIDPITKRKEFRQDFINGIGNLFSMNTHLYDNRSNCLDASEYHIIEDIKNKTFINQNYIVREPEGNEQIERIQNPEPDLNPPPGYNTSTPEDNNPSF